jgi:hypothetical protein
MPLSFKADDSSRNALKAEVLPEAFKRACPDVWQLSGEGIFSWSVFKLYRARLLTHTGAFDPAKPFLLDLHYLRTLKGEQIVSTSIDEIVRLNEITEEQRRAWTQALTEVIPDVVLGDRLLGWFTPGMRVEFFSASQTLGLIQDSDFVRMFSAIWLDERTRSPQLRQALLGHVHAMPALTSRLSPSQEASA